MDRVDMMKVDCRSEWGAAARTVSTPLSRGLAATPAVAGCAWTLSRYLAETRAFPMLSAEKELSLARRWQQHGDVEAAHKLVGCHLRLVAKIAMSYGRYGLPIGDLIAEGNLGLVRAVRSFDSERGFRLSTYAMWWIRAEIQQYVLHNWSLVKMGTTAAQKKLFFNLRRLKAQMQAIDEGDLSPETVKKIATELDVPEAEVVDMNRRLVGADDSLNLPLRADSGGERQDWLVDDSDDQETTLANKQQLSYRRRLLGEAMRGLNPRERHIMTHRWLHDDPTTLEDLSLHHKISRERVRQIEMHAMQKIRRMVAHHIPNRVMLAA